MLYQPGLVPEVKQSKVLDYNSNSGALQKRDLELKIYRVKRGQKIVQNAEFSNEDYHNFTQLMTKMKIPAIISIH